MLVNALYNIVNSYFVAKISEDVMPAISLIYPLLNISSAIAIGFDVDANAATVFYLGKNNQNKADGAAPLSLPVAMVHTIILTVVLLAIATVIGNAFTHLCCLVCWKKGMLGLKLSLKDGWKSCKETV